MSNKFLVFLVLNNIYMINILGRAFFVTRLKPQISIFCGDKHSVCPLISLTNLRLK